MKQKNTPKNIYTFFIGLVFAVGLLIASIGAYKLYSLGLDYIWQTETCRYIAATKLEIPGEQICRYDGRSALKDAIDAFAVTLALGLVAARSFKELRKQI